MDRARLERIGIVCGLLGALCIFAGFFAVDEVGTSPPDSASSTLIRELTSVHDRVRVGSGIGMTGGLLMLPFAVALRDRMSRAHASGEFLGRVAHASSVVVAAGALAYGSFRLASVTVTQPHLLEDAIRPIEMLRAHATDPMMWGLVALTICMSILSFAARMFSRVAAGIGLALAALTLLLTSTDRGGSGAMLFAWLAVVAGLLLRDRAAIAHDEGRS